MDTSLLVKRLMTSISTVGDNPTIVKRYLKVFGVTKYSKELPIVFDKQYEKQWDAFFLDRKYSSNDANTRLLLTILDYIRFMRSQRINPFVVTGRRSMNSSIRPLDIAADVLRTAVKYSYDTVMGYLRKANFTQFLAVKTRIVQLAFDRKNLIVNFGLTPLRNVSLAKLMTYEFRGTLYKTAEPPKQYQGPERRKNFRAVVADTHTSPSDWLPLTSINNMKIFAQVTRDAFAIRVVIPVDHDYARTPKDLQGLVSLWKSVK